MSSSLTRYYISNNDVTKYAAAICYTATQSFSTKQTVIYSFCYSDAICMHKRHWYAVNIETPYR